MSRSCLQLLHDRLEGNLRPCHVGGHMAPSWCETTGRGDDRPHVWVVEGERSVVVQVGAGGW